MKNNTRKHARRSQPPVLDARHHGDALNYLTVAGGICTRPHAEEVPRAARGNGDVPITKAGLTELLGGTRDLLGVTLDLVRGIGDRLGVPDPEQQAQTQPAPPLPGAAGIADDLARVAVRIRNRAETILAAL